MAEKEEPKFYRVSVRVTPEFREQLENTARIMGIQYPHLSSVALSMGFKLIQRAVDPSSQLPLEAWEEIAKRAEITAEELQEIVTKVRG